MVKIRLARGGVKRKPFYRIVVIDEKQKGKGAPIENIGFWHPSEASLKIDKAKVRQWQAKGAKLSEAVARLLKTSTDK